MNSEAFRAHIRWMRLRGLAGTTITQRAAVMRRLAAYCDGKPLLDITETELIEWADDLATRVAVSSRAFYVSNVREFYRWCYAEHRIAADPAANLPVPRVPARQPRPIDEDSLEVAISYASPRIRLWLVLAAFCGLRACDVAHLRGENIRLADDPPYILVTESKGGKERIVPLNDYVVAEFRRYPNLPARGPVFRNAGGQRISENAVSVIANRHLRDVGVQDVFHQLRHRFGTQVQRAYRDLRVTQELLGHSNVATTAIYAGVADLDKYRAVTALPTPATQTAL